MGPILGPKRALLPQVLAETKTLYRSLLGHITPMNVIFDIISHHTTRSEEINLKTNLFGAHFGAKEALLPQVLAETKKLYYSLLGHITPIN